MTIASKESNKRVDKISLKERIYQLLTTEAMTYDDIKRYTSLNQATITARISELLDDGKIMERSISDNKTVFARVFAVELQKTLKEKRQIERSSRVLKAFMNDKLAVEMYKKQFKI